MTRIKAWHGFTGIRLRILLGLMLCALPCAANPANNIDPDGKEWRQKKDSDDKTIAYEWVEGDDARDKDGNLLPGVYETAIFFTSTGNDAKEFNPNCDFNMGSSIAIVFGKNGENDIQFFEACTNPSDPQNAPRCLPATTRLKKGCIKIIRLFVSAIREPKILIVIPLTLDM